MNLNFESQSKYCQAIENLTTTTITTIKSLITHKIFLQFHILHVYKSNLLFITYKQIKEIFNRSIQVFLLQVINDSKLKDAKGNYSY